MSLTDVLLRLPEWRYRKDEVKTSPVEIDGCKSRGSRSLDSQGQGLQSPRNIPPRLQSTDLESQKAGGIRNRHSTFVNQHRRCYSTSSPWLYRQERRRRRIVYISRRSLLRYSQDIKMYGCNMENTFDIGQKVRR
ncbi:hypothetical protein ARMGADRAFT_219175 [Armillaria gallica]|uniref:Uncharacterized protein n=1 Tax=Armillaria gallica TaxID=47427 RepID=A0A2H3DBU8_ARMGA|nr:hypothetical protein ARMGADRAFT_219175 [Armillaria gallica]